MTKRSKYIFILIIFLTNMFGSIAWSQSLVNGKNVDQSFFVDVLNLLYLPASTRTLNSMSQWQKSENTNAYWNPLATTWRDGIPQDKRSDFNSVHVQNYLERQYGVNATAWTLQLHYYDSIRDMLAGTAFNRDALHQSLATWSGEGAYVNPLIDYWWSLWDGVSSNCASQYTLQGNILAKYNSLGGPSSFLGCPVSDQANPMQGYSVARFENGAIYSYPRGTFEVHGDNYKKYVTNGELYGPLGSPLSDQTTELSGYAVNRFELGAIYSYPRGTFEVHGPTYEKYVANGELLGPLGSPLSDVTNPMQGYSVSRFELGTIYSYPRGTYEVHGDNYQKYLATGELYGPLGSPLSDQTNPMQGYSVNRFELGTIYSYPRGTFEVHGPNYEKYVANGELYGPLGSPLSDQTTELSGYAVNRFELGAIYTYPRGTYESHGLIYQKYREKGELLSPLGSPMSDVYAWQGGERQDFESDYMTTATPSVGDVDGDGSVNVSDVVLVLQFAVGITPLNEEQKRRADIAPVGSPDGLVDVTDAVAILRVIVGI